ncbi:MAG: protelomerase family protein [Pleurocapsa sp. MO_226.B13]|nr:protelomerase family protein [Pleurocapsa sp. MO_226.B13]
MVSLDSDKFNRACGVARTKWLRQLLAEHLTRLIELSGSKEDLEIAKQWDSLIKQKFVERGLISLHQQKNRITDVRNAIKVIDPNHPALNVVGFTAHEWMEINSMAASATASRTTQFLASTEAIAFQAAQLLQSRIWSEVAAGLAVVTGRRVSEILKTAHFTFKSTYSVLFTGAVKRRQESVALNFEIPTLVEANTVIEAIAKLRGWLDTSHLTNRQINERYEQAVAQACERYFRDLVPLREGKGNLYTHLFRAVYATIATHWFCPPTVSDLEFRAYIQGHFQILNEANEQKRTSMAAQRHYWDYKIADGQGNVDGRLGIKLQQSGVQVLEAFDTAPTPTPTLKQSHGRLVHLRVFSDDRTTLARIQAQFDLHNRAAANHFVLELAQSLLSTADTLNQTPQQLTAKLTDLASDSLQTSVPDLEAEKLKLEPDGDSDAVANDRPLSVQLSQQDETTEDSSALPDVDQSNAVDSSLQDAQLKTEELSDVERQTATQSEALFDRLDRQQQSLSSLTDAIHGLVKVLANPTHPTSTNPTTHSESSAKSEPTARERSKDLVTSTALERRRSSIETETPEPTKSSALTDKISRQRRSELSRQKVNQYIDRIIAYNDVQDRPHADKWLITIAALKRLTHCGQSVIYDVLNSRASEIQFHHDRHQLGIYHNQKGKNSPKIESEISLP